MNAIDIYFTFKSLVKQPSTPDRVSELIYNTIGEFFGKTTGNYIEETKGKLMITPDLEKYVLEKGQNKSIFFDKAELIDVYLERSDSDYFNNPPIHSWNISYILTSKTYKCLAVHPDRTYTCYLPENNEIIDIKLINSSYTVYIK